ncbi:MAG: M50 family metallopeptidase [Oscillospiraceae bacterium]|jgi:regulator of sigma E protease|nr:M50 family metallopeptidase [Oscillospiraceae bacterium]
MYILIAILAFGVIIAIHELGHYFSAKALNVKVNEFAIGMGPKILWKQGKETLYSLRALPFGGFCSLEGEHDEGEVPNPRSFLSQKRWKRIVILVSGSFANFIAAFIIIVILTLGATGFISTTISEVVDNLADVPDIGVAELRAGDRLVAINGERLFYYEDFNLFMRLNEGYPIVFTIERDGHRLEYERVPYVVDGKEVYRYSISFKVIESSFIENTKFAFYQTFNFIRMIRVSIAMMISGSASIADISGPVGIIDAMNTVGQHSPTFWVALSNIVYFTAFIGVNVAVINLLPIPAMDGGRVFFIFVTLIIEKLTRKKLDPKYENYINTTAFILLIGLMVLILYNDIIRIIGA